MLLVNQLKNLTNKGQSLIEIVIMAGVLIIAVSGIVVVTLNGLKNSQYSSSQVKATKLAQEGLSKVRNIKITNCPVEYLTTNYLWSKVNPTDLTIWSDFPASTDITFKFVDPPSPACMQGLSPAGADTSLESSFNKQFKRVITMNKNSDETEITVTSEVEWNDFSGVHTSKQVTIISNY